MKKILLLVSSLVCFTNPVWADDAQLLKDKLHKITMLDTSFKQQVTNPAGEVIAQSSGTLLVSRPGKFRWEVKEPESELMVTNGETLWLYSPFIEQVTLLNTDDAFTGTPFVLLSGGDDAAWQQYTIKQQGSQFLLSDITAQGPTTQYIFEFNKDDQVKRLLVIDNQGQQSEFKLTHLTSKTLINKNTFYFTVPKGVEVDDQR